MCDYSLESYKSRAAVNGDELAVRQFPSGSKGFVEAKRMRSNTDLGGAFRDNPVANCAVCCKDGVEMTLHLEGTFPTRRIEAKTDAFEKNEKFDGEIPVTFHTLARENLPMTAWGMIPFVGYRDGFILPNGRFLSLQRLSPGTRATVTKALPKEIIEAAKGEKAFEPEVRVQEIVAPVLVD